MNVDESIRLLKAREYTVTKSNEIVQKSRYELSTIEQKTIAYICSMIKPRGVYEKATQQPYILDYEFNIKDYCIVCNIDYSSGRNYSMIKDTLKKLIQKVMWLTLPDGSETTVNWVQKVRCNKRSGKINIKLDEDMIPYLFDLQEKFVAYGLYSILAMKSQYSIRLYELLKSYKFQSPKTIEINELKKLLMVENIKSYSNYKDFRVKVLEVAKDEINDLTDLQVYINPNRKGRKVTSVTFKILNKDENSHRISFDKVQMMLGDIK